MGVAHLGSKASPGALFSCLVRNMPPRHSRKRPASKASSVKPMAKSRPAGEIPKTQKAPPRDDFWRAPLRTGTPHRHRLVPSRRALRQRFRCLILPSRVFDPPREAAWDVAALCERVECPQQEDLPRRRDRLHLRRPGSWLTRQEWALPWQVQRQWVETPQLCLQVCCRRALSSCPRQRQDTSRLRLLTSQRSLLELSLPLWLQLDTDRQCLHRPQPFRRLHHQRPRACRHDPERQDPLGPPQWDRGQDWSSPSLYSLLHPT